MSYKHSKSYKHSNEYNDKMNIAEWVTTKHERPSGKKTYHRWVGTSIFLEDGLLDVDLHEESYRGGTVLMTPDEAEAFAYTLIAASRQMREKLGQDNE